MVLVVSIVMVIGFIIIGISSPLLLENFSNTAFAWISEYFGWLYLVVVLVILFFGFFIAISPYGKIKLGKDDDQPEYSTFSWISMLFCAGMGIGLVFWSVAEPASHFLNPPLGLDPMTEEAANAAIQFTFLHWGLHPWGIYALVGLTLAYSIYRRNRPCLISSIFQPLMKAQRSDLIKNIIDILALLLTAIGVATSLGLGTLQVAAGLSGYFGISNSLTFQILIIVIITILFLIDAISGLDKGIKMISNFNIIVALILIAFLIILGPASTIIKIFFTGIGNYIGNFIQVSFNLSPFGDDSWIKSWTVFYWAWWITWAPFVGTFIARISKGRTIREFVMGVLIVPTLFSFLWFSAFGGTMLDFEVNQNIRVAADVVKDINSGLFTFYLHLPASGIISILTMILIITFFVTSADSATFVISMFSRKGNLNPDNKIKVIWGVFLGLIAIVLLMSGGLNAVQGISIVVSFPFLFILAASMVAFIKDLKKEKKR
ncbi:BCCT family transporter [Eubacteriaceae bacterium ES2]|nr:BCCT family transporter [Eubacteriaceae bacterium ES2]